MSIQIRNAKENLVTSDLEWLHEVDGRLVRASVCGLANGDRVLKNTEKYSSLATLTDVNNYLGWRGRGHRKAFADSEGT